MAGRPAHGWHWQADIRSGLRCWLERPLSEAQLTMDPDWAGALLERLLRRQANSQCRPVCDIHGPNLIAAKPPLEDSRYMWMVPRTCKLSRMGA